MCRGPVVDCGGWLAGWLTGWMDGWDIFIVVMSLRIPPVVPYAFVSSKRQNTLLLVVVLFNSKRACLHRISTTLSV